MAVCQMSGCKSLTLHGGKPARDNDQPSQQPKQACTAPTLTQAPRIYSLRYHNRYASRPIIIPREVSWSVAVVEKRTRNSWLRSDCIFAPYRRIPRDLHFRSSLPGPDRQPTAETISPLQSLFSSG